MITEWELECAIYSHFEGVLPDLHSQGYRIERQVLIKGISRRMDIILMKDDHSWIIELKRGSLNVADTTAQIRDYQRCWSAAYPKIPVSLMVISTGASESKIKAFAAHGIFYRAVPESKVLEALSFGQSTELLGRCNHLPAENEGRIRFLLSNFAHTSVPDGMRFGKPWSHDSVFYALIRDGHETKKPWLKNIYVKLFDHNKPNCAVLYHSEAANFDGAPLHLNPRAKSWPADGWLLTKLINSAAIEYVLTDNKGPDRENGNFDHYRILNWDMFAQILGLKS